VVYPQHGSAGLPCEASRLAEYGSGGIGGLGGEFFGLTDSTAMIEIAVIIIAVAVCVIAVKVNRILKLLEAENRSRADAQRIRQLERIKP
jgi:uncharacterized membrane protein